MLYLFVLGRDSELSKLEIECVLNKKKISYKFLDSSKAVLVVDCDKLEPSIMNKF